MIYAIAGIAVFIGGLFGSIWWLSVERRGLILELLAPALATTLALYIGLFPALREAPQIYWIAPLAALAGSIAIRLGAKVMEIRIRSTDIDELREAWREPKSGDR